MSAFYSRGMCFRDKQRGQLVSKRSSCKLCIKASQTEYNKKSKDRREHHSKIWTHTIKLSAKSHECSEMNTGMKPVVTVATVVRVLVIRRSLLTWHFQSLTYNKNKHFYFRGTFHILASSHWASYISFFIPT